MENRYKDSRGNALIKNTPYISARTQEIVIFKEILGPNEIMIDAPPRTEFVRHNYLEEFTPINLDSLKQNIQWAEKKLEQLAKSEKDVDISHCTVFLADNTPPYADPPTNL